MPPKNRPSDRYKHKLSSPKGRPAKRSAKSGQSKAAQRMTGGSRAKNSKAGKRGSGEKGGRSGGRGGGGGRGGARGGGKNAVPKRLEKKTAKKRGFFGTLIKRLCGTVNVDVNLSETAQQYADSVGLQNDELKKLLMVFKMIDYDESGEVDAEEFMEFINEKKTPFTNHIFKLIDEDGSGEVDQNEFIGMMCLYCMYSKEEILRFTFDSFDDDKSGTLDEEEFMEVAKCVNDASPMFPGNFRTALEEFDQNDDGLIDFDEFNILNRRYPLVLFPAFRLQDNMQKYTLGTTGWTKVGRRVFKAKYIAEYMKVHGGEIPPESFFTKFSRCFQTPVEVEMAQRMAQAGEFGDDGGGKKKKGRKRRKN